MLSYVYLGTNNPERAIQFYNRVLGALGMKRCETHDPEWDKISAGWAAYIRDPDGNKLAAVCRGFTGP